MRVVTPAVAIVTKHTKRRSARHAPRCFALLHRLAPALTLFIIMLPARFSVLTGITVCADVAALITGVFHSYFFITSHVTLIFLSN